MQKDNLDERNLEFSHQPLTAPVFLNSVPKSGTHLMRNIMRMFVANEQQYHDTFIQIPIMHNHARAFDPAQPFLLARRALRGFRAHQLRRRGGDHHI